MLSTLAANATNARQRPCYAALAGLCSDPPKHTMIVIPAPSLDGWMPIQQEELPNATDASLRPRDRIHRD